MFAQKETKISYIYLCASCVFIPIMNCVHNSYVLTEKFQKLYNIWFEMTFNAYLFKALQFSSLLYRWRQSWNTWCDPWHRILSHTHVSVEADGSTSARNDNANVFRYVTTFHPINYQLHAIKSCYQCYFINKFNVITEWKMLFPSMHLKMYIYFGWIFIANIWFKCCFANK